ncbi:MAG: GNAT family N-acetyltransferase [Chloroflexi bacterium]|nr:GNAT family N-acetyltransferase [Chloroflexota bacterium]
MKVIEHPSRELWHQVVAASPYATFFHTPIWADILAATYPDMHIATKAFVLDDGTVAIVPIAGTIERNRLFRWYESMFPGGYGGPVARRSLTREEVLAISRHLINPRTAFIHIMGNPFFDREENFCISSNYVHSIQYTHLMSLDKGFDEVFNGYIAEKRRYTRKAMKMGVEIAVAEEERDYRQYYEVYLDTLQRWGETTLVRYPSALFDHMCRQRSQSIKLWIAKVNGDIVAGKVVFYHNQQAFYWHGATLQHYFNHHPGPLLMTEIIKDACQIGIRYLDLGPSGGLPGVEHYKESFGAEKRYFGSYVWDANQLYRAYQRLRRAGNRKPAGATDSHPVTMMPGEGRS